MTTSEFCLSCVTFPLALSMKTPALARWTFQTLLVITAVTLLSACGLTRGKEFATQSVDTFHQQFNDAKFREIYSAATPAFKSASKEEDFMKFMQAVRRKLGAFKTGTQNGWNVNAFNGVTRVLITYKSDFEQGAGVETFTYLISGESAVLQGYNISSPTLIIN
jgi:hypothetical protein